MRLLTHNLLVCNVKACVETSQRAPSAAPLNFPLRVRVADRAGARVRVSAAARALILPSLLAAPLPLPD
jgi:hypothetical protein